MCSPRAGLLHALARSPSVSSLLSTPFRIYQNTIKYHFYSTYTMIKRYFEKIYEIKIYNKLNKCTQYIYYENIKWIFMKEKSKKVLEVSQCGASEGGGGRQKRDTEGGRENRARAQGSLSLSHRGGFPRPVFRVRFPLRLASHPLESLLCQRLEHTHATSRSILETPYYTCPSVWLYC